MKLRKSLEDVLKSMRTDEHSGPTFARKQIEYEDHQPGKIWLGVYSSDFWVGFGFDGAVFEGRPFMMVQRSFEGDRRKSLVYKTTTLVENWEKPEYDQLTAKTWLSVKSRIEPNYDGDGEKMRDWMLSRLSWLRKNVS